jgi:TatD DNase family protein
VAASIPLERILLETDAPYLAPVPYRGKRNESAYIPVIAEKIAALKGVSIAEVDEVTSASATVLFGL